MIKIIIMIYYNNCSRCGAGAARGGRRGLSTGAVLHNYNYYEYNYKCNYNYNYIIIIVPVVGRVLLVEGDEGFQQALYHIIII